jgi:bifunctional non-homologous end joining protein LigD
MTIKGIKMATAKTSLKVGAYTIELTNTDKVLFPADGFTKGDLINYYQNAAKFMLPHLKGRPLTMQRFPNGIDKEGFFQKSAGDYFPSWIKRAAMKKQDGTTDYVICHDAATLVYLAEQDCITHHIWLSRMDKPDFPDLMIFDLDPPDDDFEPIRRAAFILHDLLTELGLEVFVKSTGSRGLHVTVPLDRSVNYDTVRAFAGDIAKIMVSRNPDGMTTEERKDKRQGRVFIDVLRNSYNQTAVAPYTVRARLGAPVAAPIDWDELKDPKFHPQKYNIKNVFQHLDKKGNPWEKLFQSAKSLDGAGKRLDGIKTK